MEWKSNKRGELPESVDHPAQIGEASPARAKVFSSRRRSMSIWHPPESEEVAYKPNEQEMTCPSRSDSVTDKVRKGRIAISRESLLPSKNAARFGPSNLFSSRRL
jgi:hypothetical protein